jgi:membrane associated rhomboid family serine protease
MNDQQDNEATRTHDVQETHREPAFNLPPVVLALIGVCAFLFVAGEYLLSSRDYQVLLQYGAFNPNRAYVDPTALVTLVTYSLLHGSWPHLLVNMIWLAAFGSPLANRLGALRFLSFWVATSVAAALLYWAFHVAAPVLLVGASGAISGMMGAAARFGFRIDRSRGKPAFSGMPLPISVCLRSRAVVTFLSIWMLINLVTGLIPFAPGVDDQIAWEAHIGGFLAGFLGISGFGRREGRDLPPPNPNEDDEEAS